MQQSLLFMASLQLPWCVLWQVGIIPTDSLPAVVCNLENRNAALKMYNVMELAPKKQLSILVGSFNDISR
jgi:tRNA A37 threonylcarbamoyladenosine synthetase subunit TsaC/SUA5/YrdC